MNACPVFVSNTCKTASAPPVASRSPSGDSRGIHSRLLGRKFGFCSETVARFHEKFGDKLVVMGISDEKEEVVRKFTEENIKYFSALDTTAGRLVDAAWPVVAPAIGLRGGCRIEGGQDSLVDLLPQERRETPRRGVQALHQRRLVPAV